MRLLFVSLLLMMPLFAEVPKTDLRNGALPDTDTQFQPRQYTRAEWDARKPDLKQRILFAAGLDPMPARTPLNAIVLPAVKGDGYIIEKVLLETMPGFFLGGNIYRPAEASGKVPAILHPHGHWTYGRLENQPLNSAPTLGINMARQGFVVFAYDMVGYNDSPQVPHRFTGQREQLWQFTPLGLQLWNSIRSLDFLEQLPYVDAARIGITGASGGGTQTFLLAAVDDRIAASAPVNMVSLVMQGGCVCENAPHLRVDTQNVEIAALTAPRPQFIVAATGDWTRNVPKVEFPAVRQIYALYDAADKVEYAQFDAPHNFHKPSREAVYGFFHKVFLGKADSSPVAERSASVPDARDLLVLWNRSLPGHALSFEELFASWRAMSDAQTLSLSDQQLRARLAMATEASLPDRVSTASENGTILVSAGKGDRVPIHIRKGAAGATEAVVLVHPAGGKAALADSAMTTAVARGVPVYAPDIYQTGISRAESPKRHQHHATFNATDDAQRVQDILSAIAYARQEGARSVRLVAARQGQAWAILAAALSDGNATVDAPPYSAHPEWTYDEWLSENCFIPGLQRAGGIPAALRLLGIAR